MKSKAFISILTIFFALVLFTGCEKILQTEPRSSISSEVALEDMSGVNAVLVGAYNTMQGSGYYGRDFIVAGELLCDNAKLAAENSNRFPNHPTNQAGSHIGNYQNSYLIILKANYVLEFVDGVSDGTAAQKAKAKGEAYFLRALGHFDLVRTYAYEPGQEVDGFNLGVVISTETFKGDIDASLVERDPVSAVYAQIESDLDDAIALLDNSGLPYYPGKASAQALLSRVLLYKGDWTGAIAAANDAIAGASIAGVTVAAAADYDDIFDAGAESLYELKYLAVEALGSNSLQSIYMKDDNNQGYGDIIYREDAIQMFDHGNDVRWARTKAYTKSGEDVIYTTKYMSTSTTTYLHNVPIIRISEVLLNRAEAYYEDSQEDLARADVNAIRTNRGLAALDLTVTGTALGDSIMLERRRELAFEGHRWYDLKRKGMDIPKGVDGVDPATAEGNPLPYTSYKILAPIPTRERDANPNLTPNPGY